MLVLPKIRTHPKETIRVKKHTRTRRVKQRAQRAKQRAAMGVEAGGPQPLLHQTIKPQYDMAQRTTATAAGGLSAIHMMVTALGIPAILSRFISILKRPQPYHDSDHVLTIAYNVIAGGQCLEHLDKLREDEALLAGLGTHRLPDPTTAGDFCRRFKEKDIDQLQEGINEARAHVWREQMDYLRPEAIIDADGTIEPTNGECKDGIDMSYNGEWSYHPLVVSLANTQEPIYIVNRPGNRPSHEGAAEYLDRAIALCKRVGFEKVLLRGDTDFSQTAYLDGWDDRAVRFVFGFDALPGLIERAEGLPEDDWRELERPKKHEVKTTPRTSPDNVRKQKIIEKEYKNLRLKSEHVSELVYHPTKCDRAYRMIVLRKNISVEKGERLLFDDIRYFFYITNDRSLEPAEVVKLANERCNQENLISQLKSEANGIHAPLGDLASNWAYMVMATLGLSLTIWFRLRTPISPRWRRDHERAKDKLMRMRFRTFCSWMIHIPAQVVRHSRRLVIRLLAYNQWVATLFRIVDTTRSECRWTGARLC
jgi:hypothetical protein